MAQLCQRQRRALNIKRAHQAALDLCGNKKQKALMDWPWNSMIELKTARNSPTWRAHLPGQMNFLWIVQGGLVNHVGIILNLI